MPKRSYEDKLDYYLKKVEKLKQKYQCKRRRREISTSDSEDVEQDTWELSQMQPDPAEMAPLEVVVEQQDGPIEPDNTQDDPHSSPAPVVAAVPAPPEPSIESVQATDDSAFPALDPDILLALGESTDQGPTWGEIIHINLTQLWDPLLKNGMPKEVKDKLIKQYLIPSNCTLLQAPRLNIEISAAVAEMVRLRDKKVETNQQQLGIGITAISRAMTSLIMSQNKIDAIKTLSDGCRILCDLHHSETQARIKMITPGLAKPFLNVIQDSERDETLFGVSLPDKIKASKTIEKQGLQIKKTAPSARPSSIIAPAAPARQQYQGNWNGPPRYQANRGGRAAPRRYPSYTRRPATTAAALTAQAQPRASSSRSRAQARN